MGSVVVGFAFSIGSVPGSGYKPCPGFEVVIQGDFVQLWNRDVLLHFVGW